MNGNDYRDRIQPRADLDLYRQLGAHSEAIAGLRRDLERIREELLGRLESIDGKLAAARKASGQETPTPWWGKQPALSLLVVLAAMIVLAAAVGGDDLLALLAGLLP